MRSARMLLATSAASAALFLAAPGAYAAEWDNHEDSSYGKETDRSYGKETDPYGKETDKSYGKETDSYGKEQHKHGKHDTPRGGMHAGGGALTTVNDNGWGAPRDTKLSSESSKDSERGSDSWKGEHHKPRGGMHTGGGALDAPSVTAGGLAVLAVAATGMYAMRRTRAGSAA